VHPPIYTHVANKDIKKLGWGSGTELEADAKGSKLIIEKLTF